MNEKNTTSRFVEGPANEGEIKILQDEIYDRRLGIWWKKDAELEKAGKPLKCTWSDALAHAWQQAADDKHERNWRLPTIEELSSLVNIDEKGKVERAPWLTKDDQDDWFWTSSPVADDADYAWVVDFSRGAVNDLNHRDVVFRVRLVRGVSRSVI